MRLPVAVSLLVGVTVAAGCTVPSVAPTPSPTAAPFRIGLDWATADVERPTGFEVDPSATAEAPAGPGAAGHPGHFSGQAYIVDVTTGGPGFVAVGYVYPGWHATVWTSIDGGTWQLADVEGDEDGSFLDAVTGLDTGLIGVGRRDRRMAMWTSGDARAWQPALLPDTSDDREACVPTVAATPLGVVVGSCAGLPTGIADTRFWRSPDGVSWEAATVDEPEDGRVTGVAPGGPGLVAVGMTGASSRPTGSVTWTSTDGTTWSRGASSDVLEGAVLRAVVSFDGGLVAIGESIDGQRAVVVRSADGIAWQRVDDQPAFSYHDQPIRMTDVTVAGDRLIAVGHHLFGQQYGNATSWVSSDGMAWERAGASPVFPQGEMLAVTATDARVVAVGTYGAPDNFIPTVWVSPPP